MLGTYTQSGEACVQQLASPRSAPGGFASRPRSPTWRREELDLLSDPFGDRRCNAQGGLGGAAATAITTRLRAKWVVKGIGITSNFHIFECRCRAVIRICYNSASRAARPQFQRTYDVDVLHDAATAFFISHFGY